jgi:hypothetical protein
MASTRGHPLFEEGVRLVQRDPALAELRRGGGVDTRESYNKSLELSVGVWESLPEWSKGLVLGGLGLSAVGLLASLLGRDSDEDEDDRGRRQGGSALGGLAPLATIGGLGAAAYGLSGGQPGRLVDPTFWSDAAGEAAGALGLGGYVGKK